jgi:arylsulfatase A-like enzyme
MVRASSVTRLTVRVWVKAMLLFACAMHAFGDDRNPPNVVLIFVDDLGYCASGLYGCEAPTPNIQRLADEGARFTDGYVTSPVCSPSRAGLLTGRSQQRFGHDYLPEGAANGNGGLPVGEITLADAMKQAGYVTGMVGKWHLGHSEEFHPINRGFDEFFGLLGASTNYADHAREDVVVRTRWGMELPLLSYSPDDLTLSLWSVIKAFFFEPGAPMLMRGTDHVQEDSYLTEAFSREAVDFINRHRDESFFLYLPYTAVHHPLQVPRAYYDQFPDIEDESIRILTAMAASLDDGVGSVLNALEANGLEENTLVFFISDNGAGADGVSNAPLRLGKHSLFEGGNRVPFVMKWPGNIPAGLTYSHPVSALDVFPTSLVAAGAELPEDSQLEGVDLLPYLNASKGTPAHKDLFWRQGPNWAVRSGNWKLTFAADRHWLYDLSKDIGEKNNLAGSHPEKISQLTEKYREWNSHNSDPAWPAFSSKTMSELSVDDVPIEWVF